MYQEFNSNNSLYGEEEEDYSPSSSAFESCSSDLTDDSTVVSTVSSTNGCYMKEEEYREDYLQFPPITLSFHESLSFDMLKLYQVRIVHIQKTVPGLTLHKFTLRTHRD